MNICIYFYYTIFLGGRSVTGMFIFIVYNYLPLIDKFKKNKLPLFKKMSVSLILDNFIFTRINLEKIIVK